jgi:hypothetical protein
MSVRWNKPTDPLPENFCVGDRLLIVVAERKTHCEPIRPFLVVIEATETGWRCDDDTFNGYSKDDGVAWACEREVLKDAASAYD